MDKILTILTEKNPTVIRVTVGQRVSRFFFLEGENMKKYVLVNSLLIQSGMSREK